MDYHARALLHLDGFAKRRSERCDFADLTLERKMLTVRLSNGAASISEALAEVGEKRLSLER
jgi:hypothetical protein